MYPFSGDGLEMPERRPPMFATPHYDHTQQGWFHWLLYAVAAGMLAATLTMPYHPVATYVLPSAALLMVVLSVTSRNLNVRDEGHCVLVQFGPLHVFKKRIDYKDIVEVRADRSTWIDGWGAHWNPRHGWIWNIWGFDCVRLTLANKRVFRIGTDEPQKLTEFLKKRTEEAGKKP